MRKHFYLLLCTLFCTLVCLGEELSTGEYAFLADGTPAMNGQATRDHLFVRGDYENAGVVLDNKVSFKLGTPQTVWFWLDDDSFYENEKVQALKPIALNSAGTEFYNEVAYNSFQCDIYLPQSMSFIASEDEDGEEIMFTRGDRLPNTSNISWKEKEGRVIDGKNYRVYTVVCSNNNGFGCHLSSKNAKAYRDFYAENNRPRQKYDAPVFGLFLMNANQDQAEGHLDDMIIANQEFGFLEAFTADPKWEPNEYRFIFGTGGNNETQRFQLYNRVALYGSGGYDNESPDVLATSIDLNQSAVELTKGDTFQLTATVLPSDATNKTVTWATTNSTIATVDNNGMVTAKAPGSATVIAMTTDGSNLCATCELTVNPVLASSVSLSKTSAQLTEGETMQLTATVLPADADNKVLTWTSTNSSIATVNSSGFVTAISPGTATIIAATTDGSNLRASCVVTVKSNIIQATSISLDKTNAEMATGQYLLLNATVLPENTTNKTVTWSSSNNSIATVDNDGKVTAISPGTTAITAMTTDGTNLKAICYVTVKDITFSLDNIEASAGSTVTIPIQLHNTSALKAIMLDFCYPNGFTVMHRSKTDRLDDDISIAGQDHPEENYYRCIVTNFSSNIVVQAGDGPIINVTLGIPLDASGDYEIALQNIQVSVPSDGSGQSLINGCSSILTVHEFVHATSIQLNQTSAELVMDETLQLTATVLPEDANEKDVVWASSDEAVASVDDNGLVTALAVGSATITATTTDGTDLSASCLVTVTENLIEYGNYLSMNDTTVKRGETIVIPIRMVNTSNIIAFQTDLILPDGLEVLQEDGEYLIDPSSRMTRTHSIMSNDVSSGAIRVICYSSNYKPFTGNSGDDLFYITVKVADDAEGDYTIQLKNTLLTNTDFVDLAAPNVAGTVHVKGYLLGDANNSGTVSVTDVVVTAQYVLELDPHPFVFEAADVNFDNNITVADVSRIAWMVLNPTLSAPKRAPALWNNGDRMGGEGIALAVGETRTVSILLDNTIDYSAFQFDLSLPEGLTADNFCLTDRANGHAFDVNTLASGKTRALCYSPSMATIQGNEGALLTFDVTANSAIDDVIRVDGIELVTGDCQSVRLDAFDIAVNSTTAVNELTSGKSIAKVEYFNLAGQQLDRPDGGVILVVTTYTDGTRSTSKIIR